MMRRASASEVDRAGRQHLHGDVAERGRLGRPGQHAPAGRVGGELIQQPVARSAADNLHLGDRDARHLFERVEHDAVLEREALEDRAGDRGRTGRLRLTRAPAVLRRSRSPCRADAGTPDRRDRTATTNGVPIVAAPRPSAPRSRSCGRRAPSRGGTTAAARARRCSSAAASCPPTPPSLVKFASSVRGVMIGRGTSVPSSDHVPELRNARPPNAGTDATAEPVSWQAGATTGVPFETRGDRALQSAEHRAGLHERRQQARRDVQLAQQRIGPVALPRVDHLRRRRATCIPRAARRSASS